ncbi:MAG TPA: MarR family transcriptional regulator [Steroidobacteraceae bacterium]|jgi:DNA-binding MarR family transcriptional regulator|nr:MarR family transcriptional regulator [Steroidobacteraceae bacterium]
MERIEDCISFVIGKAAQQIARRAREKLAVHGVTPIQYAILKVLGQQDGQSGAELGARLVMDSATMTGVIDRLQASGLLERQADADDRRIQRLFVTEQGRLLQKPMDAAMDQLNDEVTRNLGEQGEVFWHALRRLGENRG